MAVVCNTEGVPLMAPVDELNESPLGTAGLISHVVTLPPLMAGVVVVMSVPFSSVKSCDEYTTVLGATSLMVMLMETETEPPELLAQTV